MSLELGQLNTRIAMRCVVPKFEKEYFAARGDAMRTVVVPSRPVMDFCLCASAMHEEPMEIVQVGYSRQSWVGRLRAFGQLISSVAWITSCYVISGQVLGTTGRMLDRSVDITLC